MKNKKLEKIAKTAAHPFLSILPNQEYLDKKLEWYNPVLGILESSAAEIVLPLIYLASSNPNPAELLVGGAIIIDGIWRINKLMDELPPEKNPSDRYLGTNFLEIPYGIYKKIRKK
jgi:hypothetical protein